jgi:hypothetical protein
VRHCRRWALTECGGVDGLEGFQEQRSPMFGIAYRMVGSVTDAEAVL